MYRTILVPLDGSQRAEKILSHVEHIAKRNQAKVVFLKVEEEPVMLDRDEVIDYERYHARFEEQKERSRSYLAALQSRFKELGIPADFRLAYGSVVKSILTTATDTGADLLAIATHGWSGLAWVSYGSVAAGVLQATELPILLIQSRGEHCAEE